MAVVDSHVHLLPGRIGEKVRAFFTAGEDRGAFTLAYPDGHRLVADQLSAEGVEEIWCLPYSHREGAAEVLNEGTAAVRDSLAGHPLSVIGGATAHPDDDSPGATVERAHAHHGLRVLKLHCSVGRFAVDDPRMDGAYRVASDLQMPVVVHLGHNVNGLTEEHELDGIARLCGRFPSLPVVLAHFGHHSAPQAAYLLDEHGNLHADLTPVVTSPPQVTHAILTAHSSRILFGTDAPNTAITAAAHMKWLASFGLDEQDRAAVLGGNARRLTDAVAR